MQRAGNYQILPITVDGSGNIIFPSGTVTFGAPIVTTGPSSQAGAVRFMNPAASGRYNWQLAAQFNATNSFEITPSTAVDGTTFTGPALLVSRGNLTIIPRDGLSSGILRLTNPASSGAYNWQIASGFVAANAFEITPSTAADGSTFSTPVIRAAAVTGLLTLGQSGTTQILAINTTTTATGAATATLTNAPAGAAGNPDIWLNLTINGTAYVLPAWTP